MVDISGSYGKLKRWVNRKIATIVLSSLADVDDTNKANDKILQYKSASEKHEYVDPPSGYTDADAIAAVLADDAYVKNTGDLMTGDLEVTGVTPDIKSRYTTVDAWGSFRAFATSNKHPRTTFTVGSELGNALHTAGLWIVPDISSGQKPTFVECMTSPDNTTLSTKRIKMQALETHAEIVTSSRFGYTDGDGQELRLSVGGFVGWILTLKPDGKIGIHTTSPGCALDINSDKFRVRTAKTPATAGASGNTGNICWDANYIYVAVAHDVWKRASIATW